MPPKKQQPKRTPKKPMTRRVPNRPKVTRRGRENAPRAGRSAPVAVAFRPRKGQMNISSNKDMSRIRVTGLEPILTVNATASFTLGLDEFVNPLNPVLFPQLCREAALYDKWRPLSLRLVYEPRCPTSTVGQVAGLILPDLEVTEAASDMTQVEFYQHGIVGAPWTTFSTAVRRYDNSQNSYFTALPSEFDGSSIGSRRTMGNGVVQTYTQGGVTGALLGTWYIEYVIDLFDRRPSIVASGSGQTPVTTFTSTSLANSYSMDPRTIVNSIGNWSQLLTTSFENLASASNSAVAAYTAVTSVLLARNRFVRFNPGSLNSSFDFVFSAATATTRGALPRLRHDEKGNVQYNDGVTQGWTTTDNYVPAPDRSCDTPRSLETTPVYLYIKTDEKGVDWGANDPAGPWEILPINPPISTSSAVGDYSTYMILYDPRLNTYTLPNYFSGTLETAFNESITLFLTNFSDYPKYLCGWTTLGAVASRTVSCRVFVGANMNHS